MNLRAFFNGSSRDPHEEAQDDETSFGNILLQKGYITQEELGEAVVIQKSQAKLGEILKEVTEGRLTDDHIEEALMEQKIQRKKASHKEIRAFHSEKKQKLAHGITGSFTDIVAKLEEVG